MNELLATDFDFVTDTRLRDLLLKLKQEARSSYNAGSFLGAIVAWGGAAEGLLTWALLLHKSEALESKKTPKDAGANARPIEEWNLTSLILVARDCGILGKTAEDASWALKEFRNLVHPYRLLNQSSRPDEALALSSGAALQEISRSISGRLNGSS